MLIMLSSDTCRYILRQQPTDLLSALQSWSSQADELVISAITYAELVAGALLTAEQQRHVQLVDEFCQRLDDIVPWDAGAVDAYTRIQLQAMENSRSLNMNDAMVAAHALSLDAMLLTLSKTSFTGIEGLNLQVWEQKEAR